MEAVILLLASLTAAVSISEVCSNPPDETAGEFVELHNDSTEAVDVSGYTVTDGDALDCLQAWTGSFPHSGVVLGTTVIPAGCYAVLLENGYLNDPWLDFQPGTVILTTGDNAICNGLAASSDPLTLFDAGGTGTANVLSTFGTPLNSENWDERDDDGLDSIPFDPGEGFTLFRYPLNLPDSEWAWYSGEPTPGSPPDAPPDTFVITIDSLWISDCDPLPGSGVWLEAMVSCWGTVSPDSGTIALYIDQNGDSVSQAEELLLSTPAGELLPGTSDTLTAFFQAPEQGWYPAVCSTPSAEERLHFTTGGGVSPVITEVMANPQNEDTEEYIELYYPGPGVFPPEGCSLTDGDAVDQIVPWQNGGYIQSQSAALVIDPEYTGTLQVPPGTPLFTPANTTLGNGLTTDDPILLYGHGGTSLQHLLSTAGTPFLDDDPLLCDDDGLDGIPFDPGDGRSMERIMPEGPDAGFNWQVSQEGGTPGIVPENQGWTDLSADSLVISQVITAFFSNCGTDSAGTTAVIFSDTDADLYPDPAEILHQEYVLIEPGGRCSIETAAFPPDSGLFTIAAFVDHPADTMVSNDTAYTGYVPGNPVWPVITEVLCNPSDEDCDEFIELYFPGPGQADMSSFHIADGDATDELVTEALPFLPAGSRALILDPEYENGSQPYEIPQGTLVLNPGNTTIGDGLSGTDPVILLHDSSEVSTYGTPWDPEDDVPCDPGTDLSMERINWNLPDLQQNWYSSPDGPTPGGPPENITEGIDYSITGVCPDPPMGPEDTPTTITARITSLGTDSVEAGELHFILLAGGQQVHQSDPPVPSLDDTVTVSVQWLSTEGTTNLEGIVHCENDVQNSNDSLSITWNPAPSVCINEIYCLEPEWIELVNSTGHPVSLDSLLLSDASTETQLPETILGEGEFIVLTENESDFISCWGQVESEVLEIEDWPSLNNYGDSLAISNQSQPIDFVPYESSWGGGTMQTLERRSAEAMGFLPENWGSCIQGGTPGRANSIGETSGSGFLNLAPTVFNPPATPLQIEINLPMQACNVTIKVYDVRGMELERPYDGIVPGETLIVEWTGEGYPVGRYIIYAEALCAGQTLSDAGVVVLARPLR